MINDSTSEVKLNTANLPNEDVDVCVKKPKRVLYFSDGILEEFTDEEETDNPSQPELQVNEVIAIFVLIKQ